MVKLYFVLFLAMMLTMSGKPAIAEDNASCEAQCDPNYSACIAPTNSLEFDYQKKQGAVTACNNARSACVNTCSHELERQKRVEERMKQRRDEETEQQSQPPQEQQNQPPQEQQ